MSVSEETVLYVPGATYCTTQSTLGTDHSAREARSASLFFSVFNEKKPFHNGSCERVVLTVV